LKEQLKARGSNSLKGSKIGNKRTGVAGAIAEAASDQWLAPIARNAGTALAKGPLTAAGRFIDDRLPGVNSKDEAKRKDSTQTVVDSRTPKLSNSMPSRPVGTRQTLNGKSVYWDGYKWTASSGSPATASKATAPKAPKLPAASSPSSSSSGSSRSSGGSSMSSPVRTSSPSKPSAPKAPTYNAPGGTDKERGMAEWAFKNAKLATRLQEQQAKRGTSQTDNPLLKNDKEFVARAKSRENMSQQMAKSKEIVDSGKVAALKPATPKQDTLKIATGTSKNFRTDIALAPNKDKKKK
jgi:hypothetical protein